MSSQFAIGDSNFTPDEAAEFLKISKSFLYKLIKQGKIVPTKLGTRTIIAGSELLKITKPAA